MNVWGVETHFEKWEGCADEYLCFEFLGNQYAGLKKYFDGDEERMKNTISQRLEEIYG